MELIECTTQSQNWRRKKYHAITTTQVVDRSKDGKMLKIKKTLREKVKTFAIGVSLKTICKQEV